MSLVNRNLRLPKNKLLLGKARELRKSGNLAEVRLWQQVKGFQILGLNFDRQRIIGNYIVDFCIKRIGLAIEIDGNSHNNKKEYDNIREKCLRSYGVDLLRYSDQDVMNNLDGVLIHFK